MQARILCLIAVLVATGIAQQHQPAKDVNFYSIQKETALGSQLASEFRRDTKSLDSPTVLDYVSAIGQRLATQMDGPSFTYTFALVADDPTALHEPAAFPGGYIFVPSSVILTAADEDEFAGMLAHAIAHVASRHSTRQATRAEMANIASVPLVSMGGWTGYALRQGQAAEMPMSMLANWRRFELEADRLAARTIAALGYDPAALARYIERVQKPDTDQRKISSPLPQPSERLKAIRAVIAELPPQTYAPHEGLEKVKEEVRRVTSR